MTTPDTTEAVEDAIYYHRFAKDGGTYPANHLAHKVIEADRRALAEQGYVIVPASEYEWLKHLHTRLEPAPRVGSPVLGTWVMETHNLNGTDTKD